MLPLNRTLGEIRSDIQIRLGFGMAGQAGVVNSPLIDSMIRSAQNQLYEQFEWANLKGVHERTTGTGQQFYDYPPDCNLEQMFSLSVMWAGRYIELQEGITLEERSTPAGSVPKKFERRDQIELWPVPDSNTYDLRFEYIKTLAPMVVDSDRTSINSEIIFLHALANAKQHYRQPDAATYASQLDSMLSRLKARHRRQSTWGRKGRAPTPYDYVTSDQDV